MTTSKKAPQSTTAKKGPEDATDTQAPDAGDDVEGHNFAPNSMLSRSAAQTRERDIQRNLQKHDVKTEAKRPFFKKG